MTAETEWAECLADFATALVVDAGHAVRVTVAGRSADVSVRRPARWPMLKQIELRDPASGAPLVRPRMVSRDDVFNYFHGLARTAPTPDRLARVRFPDPTHPTRKDPTR